MPAGWLDYVREKVPSLPVDRRTGISQVETGYSFSQAQTQAMRCLECSINTVFDGSLCILCNGCVDVCPWDCLKIVRVDALDGDEKLTKIVETALGQPVEYWAEENHPSAAAMIKDDDICTRCGLCAQRCPTNALTMESFRSQEGLDYVETENR
jgi:ferredoxin